jgi:hypothetical protein
MSLHLNIITASTWKWPSCKKALPYLGIHCKVPHNVTAFSRPHLNSQIWTQSSSPSRIASVYFFPRNGRPSFVTWRGKSVFNVTIGTAKVYLTYKWVLSCTCPGTLRAQQNNYLCKWDGQNKSYKETAPFGQKTKRFLKVRQKEYNIIIHYIVHYTIH